MTGTRDREAEKAAREAAWWNAWWAVDFSWDGLGARYLNVDPAKPWIGWSVKPDGTCVETQSAPEGSKPAALQDYFRWDADAKRFRSDEELIEAGLLIRMPGQRDFHIIHLPQAYENGEATFKSDVNHDDWDKLETVVAQLLSRSDRADMAIGRHDSSSPDHRAQLDGAVLRHFPRPAAPEEDACLHLAAIFAAFLKTADAGGLEFGSPTTLAQTLFCSHANFWTARFSGGNANFYKAQFSGGDSYFEKAEFSGGHADFRNAQFSGGAAHFQKAEFSGGDANFHKAQFSGGDAYFQKAQFSGGDANFHKAQFSGGDAYFQKANFSGSRGRLIDARFESAVFRKGVRFLSAHFRGDATFRGARFAGVCEFGRSDQPQSEAPRPGAQFHGRLNLRGASFKGLADFARVRFPEKAEDRNSAFEGARFFEPLDLKGVVTLPFSAFHGIRLDKGLLLDSQHPLPEQFAQALDDAEAAIERDEDWKDASKPDPEVERRGADTRYAALEAGCRALKEAMAADGDRKREQEFFSHELAARERRVRHRLEELKARVTGLRSWLKAWSVRMQLTASQAYRFFSGYGGSILRPLVTLLGSFIVAAAVLGFLTCAFALAGNAQLSGVCFGMECGPTMHPIASNTLEAAFRGMLGPFRLLLGRGEPFAYLGDTAPVFRGLVALVMLLHGLASSALIFLGLLALRRQFQIN